MHTTTTITAQILEHVAQYELQLGDTTTTINTATSDISTNSSSSSSGTGTSAYKLKQAHLVKLDTFLKAVELSVPPRTWRQTMQVRFICI
jgi:hypothetical protein